MRKKTPERAPHFLNTTPMGGLWDLTECSCNSSFYTVGPQWLLDSNPRHSNHEFVTLITRFCIPPCKDTKVKKNEMNVFIHKSKKWSSYSRGDGPHNFEPWSSDEDDT
ncbi:hypothetical protein TNCV_1988121 [Trichonephila clavipes]|nr:hypothetical protein TNCV_1988121 [Trichonephila clavipes]